MKILAFKIAKCTICLCLAAALGLGLFAAIWACIYRLPRTAPISVDMRSDKSGNSGNKGRALLICAALANNPHGFPGHCYIVWDRSSIERLEYAESDGFVPASASELIPSLYADVRGIMADHAVVGNTRSFDCIIVRLDEEAYQKARTVKERFLEDPSFHTGVRDCVAYVDEIAAIAKLKRPPRSFVYPLDYLARLKHMNSNIAPESCALARNGKQVD